VDSPAVSLVLTRPGRFEKTAQHWRQTGAGTACVGRIGWAHRYTRQVNHVVRLMNRNLRSGLDRKPTILVTSLKVCLSKINLISLFIVKKSLFFDFP
jgi:hypothetical protein